MTQNKDSRTDNVESPCVRNCCLNNKDICLGCFRHIDEITGWLNKTNSEKQEILDICQQRRDEKTPRL